MLAEQQIDLFAPPVELEIAAQLPEWFSIQQLADALWYEHRLTCAPASTKCDKTAKQE